MQSEINAVAPGLVKTDILIASISMQFMETLESMRPIGRIADPKGIANAVVWLLFIFLFLSFQYLKACWKTWICRDPALFHPDRKQMMRR